MHRDAKGVRPGWILLAAVATSAGAAEPPQAPINRQQVVLTADDASPLTISSAIVLKKKGREHPPAVVRAVGGVEWAGKSVQLKRGRTEVARGTMVQQGERVVAELRFDAFPTCLKPDELDVVVDGTRLGRLKAPLALVGMRGNPPLAELLSILASPDQKLFPLVDKFGQYRHRSWPDKTKSEADLRRFCEREARDLEGHPGPGRWNRYGGWQRGPQLEATGFFRTEQRQGKWWLVDPDGRLFWSHGADCVRPSSGTTPISHREHYFAELPVPGAPMSEFYNSGYWAPHGFYHGRGNYRMFNFTAANLQRKYGSAWRETYAQLSHRRLRSWGLNTIGNWSDRQIYQMKQTPYVATIGAHSRTIEGSEGYWGKFPDPFDNSLRDAVRKGLSAEQGKAVGDPWCIGFFVHNELAWGKDTDLARAALASPAGQPAKVAFVDHLLLKYKNIEALNRVWGTAYATRAALAQSQTAPSGDAANKDLSEFSGLIAEQYFRVCRDEVKRAAPRQLYLGCRFAWVNDGAARAAAKYCDVVGYNRYRYTVSDFALPAGIDKPVIIGEFHFGALDRGMFHPGLRPVDNQQARSAAYKTYVQGALDHPQIVGTHWFLYGSQATTGRGDGENYQIGLLDICDTPYVETIGACREVGYGMYERRGDVAGDE